MKGLKTEEVRTFIAREGTDPIGSTPAELGAQIKRGIDRYAKIIRAGNIKVE